MIKTIRLWSISFLCFMGCQYASIFKCLFRNQLYFDFNDDGMDGVKMEALLAVNLDDDGDYFRTPLVKKEADEDQEQMSYYLQEDDQDYDAYGSTFYSPESSSTTTTGTDTDTDTDNRKYETAIIISTHLIPSHPSLDTLLETINSLKYISGLPPNSQLILTVDGLDDNTAENRKTYFLLRSNDNRRTLDSYVEALKSEFLSGSTSTSTGTSTDHNHNHIQIMVSRKHRGLGQILKDAIEILHPSTQYAYILQQDLPFLQTINHTAILQTAHDYPNLLNLVRFNTRQNEIMDQTKYPCWNQTDPIQSTNGIHLHKTPLWSDRNHWVNLKFYKQFIMTNIDLNTFPEKTMAALARKNCSFYGPYMYGLPGQKEYVTHTDGSERYGKKLKARIQAGGVKKEDLRLNTIREERIDI